MNYWHQSMADTKQMIFLFKEKLFFITRLTKLLFVDRGFIVLMPNIRGSTGYDKVFRDCSINDWGGKDLEDIVLAVNYLQNVLYVDKERIGITGQSYGDT